MFTTLGWWGQVWANLAADLMVAVAVGIFLAQYLGIRSERQKSHQLREKSLTLILNELRANKKEVGRLQEDWSKGQLAMSYLQTEAWGLASENQLLQGLDTNLADVLLETYVRLAQLEKKSRIFFEFYAASEQFRDSIEERKGWIQRLGGAARSCSKQLDKAIQALDSRSAE